MVTSARRFSTLHGWLAWLETLHPKKIDLSLDRVLIVLDRLGLREPPFEVVTVGGTNGKGSCVAMLESIYWHGGYTVGAFTSPHLWRFNERVRLDGIEASDDELIELFESIDATLDSVTLSYFEFSTVAALLHFARRRVDVAVLEVGMGGRLDAVNAVDADAALIASIDLDHMSWLGNDREAIGREKAGVMRAGKPVVIADRNPPGSVLAHAAAVGAAAHLLGRDFDYRRVGDQWHGEGSAPHRDVAGSAGADREAGRLWPRPRFGGDEQFDNAAACVAIVHSLNAALPVTPDAVADGIRAARLRGRLERQSADGVEWLFDVAHNPAAARSLRASLDRLPPAARTLAVFAAMGDKDLAGVVSPFIPIVERWFVTQADAERGATAAQLGGLLGSLGANGVEIAPDVAAASLAARAAARPGERVAVFGSFHTVGAATAALGLYCAPTRMGDQPGKWTRV